MKEGGQSLLLPGTQHDNMVVTPEGALRIGSVKDGPDTGWYTCAAVSESGSTMARVEVRVARTSDNPPPIIQMGPVNQTLPMGGSATLPCEPTGHESIAWLKDGVPLDTLSFADTRIHISADNTLTIKGKIVKTIPRAINIF